MKLLTKEIRRKLPALYTTESKQPEDVTVVVKFSDPMGGWTWYATEFDGNDIFFGYVDGHEGELGYFSLSEFEGVKFNRMLGIKRDRHFGFNTTLAEVMNR